MRAWNLKNSQGTKLTVKIAYVIITSLILGNLCGCGISSLIPDAEDNVITQEQPLIPKSDDAGSHSGSIKVIDVDGDVHETSVDVIEESEAEDNRASLPESNLAQSARDLVMHSEDGFAYTELNESARNCYLEIYSILADMLEKVELSSRDTDEIDLAFRAVMVDHPEIFYVKGYLIGKYMSGSELRKIVFSGTYTLSKKEVESKREEVENYVQRCIASCPAGAGDYEKIKYVYEYLIRNNRYVPDSENNQNILSVVENGQTVCQGYTKAMQLILGRMGVFCTLVNGKACGQNGMPSREDLSNAENAQWGGHVWNIVRCNGMYYNVDVTWGDAVITLQSDDGSVSQDIGVSYEFFMVDDATMEETHESEPVVRMPRCNSMQDNYYRHEGLYFTAVDPEQFVRAFEAAYASGESCVFFKADSPDTFSKMEKHLFNDQRIFEYMGKTNVKYVEFPERNLMMISL